MPEETDLITIYNEIKYHFGHQNWWPGETVDEIIIGAILTQSVSWQNVERAIQNLKNEDLCSLSAIHHTETDEIAKLIKPTLYFNQKAKKLKNFTNFLYRNFDGISAELFSLNLYDLREQLLNISGIGPETADSIILYAADKPIFVVDAYTKRIFSRLGFVKENWNYKEIQLFFVQNLPVEVEIFQDFHAQIVKLGKEYCTKKNPKCNVCPVRGKCVNMRRAKA